MSREGPGLPPSLLLPSLTCLLLGYDLLYSSKTAAAAMGSNGYLAVPLSLLFNLPMVFAILALQRRFPGQTVTEYAPLIIGRVPALILNIGLLAFTYGSIGLVTRDTTTMIATYLLNRTPLWAILLLGFSSGLYLVYKGVESVARACSFVFVPAVVLLTALFAAGLVNVDTRHVLPVFTPGVGPYFRGSLCLAHLFLPLVYLQFLLAFVKPGKGVYKSVFWAMGITAFVVFVQVFGAIGTFGPVGIRRYVWPPMEYVHVVDLPVLLLEQLGPVMIIVWQVLMFCAMNFGYAGIAFGFSRMVKRLSYKACVLALSPIGFIVSLLPTNIVRLREIEHFFLNAGIAVSFYPVLLWVFAAIRRKEAPPIEPS